MSNLDELLFQAVKLGLTELGSVEEDGIHYFVNGKEYIITIKEKYKGQEIAIHTHDVDKFISSSLRELGISPGLIGYNYIKFAIHLVLEDREYASQVTKKLYPEIARLCNTSPTRVERAIRHAIGSGMSKGNIHYIEKIFKHTISLQKDKPTNKEFIMTLADFIDLNL